MRDWDGLSMSDKTGGPAFPAPEGARALFGTGNENAFLGMDLRDYLAAKVLSGAMVHAENVDKAEDAQLAVLADICYRVADAMIAAREK